MKDQDQIDYAHGLISSFLTQPHEGDSPEAVSEEVWGIARSVLCWVLGHDAGTVMQNNLDEIEDLLKESGSEMFRAPSEDEIKSNGHSRVGWPKSLS